MPRGSVPIADKPLARSALPRGLLTFVSDPASAAGVAMLAVVIAAAVAAPVLAPHDPTAVSLERQLVEPNHLFPLGTDHLGRDELSRLLHGARTTLGTASVVLAAVLTFATVVGMLSGYYAGWVDTLLMGLVDLLLAFPRLVLAIAITGMLGPSLTSVMIALTVASWAGYARLIRGMVLQLRHREFIQAARALGASDVRIMFSHVATNVLGPIVVLASLDMGWIVLSISGLSFLGLGTQPPAPEWGAMLNEGRPFLQLAPRLVLHPVAAICLVVLGFNLVGDGLRDLLDPRSHKRVVATRRDV